MLLVDWIQMGSFRLQNALVVGLFAVLIASSCSGRSGDPQELIRELRHNGIVLGASTNLLEELRLEEIQSFKEVNPSIRYFSFYNGGLGVDETGALVFFSLIDPVGKAKEERKHLTKLPVLLSSGKRLMDMSRRDFIQAYGQPSAIGEPESLSSPDGPPRLGMLSYYYKNEENALTKISVMFEVEDPDMKKPLQLVVVYIEGERARHLIELGRFRIYDLPK